MPGPLGMAAVLANWLPDPTPEFGADPTPYVILMGIGFVVGVAGHVVRSKALQATGIGLIFLGVLVLPLVANLSKS
jgi:hypothetical protein